MLNIISEDIIEAQKDKYLLDYSECNAIAVRMQNMVTMTYGDMALYIKNCEHLDREDLKRIARCTAVPNKKYDMSDIGIKWIGIVRADGCDELIESGYNFDSSPYANPKLQERIFEIIARIENGYSLQNLCRYNGNNFIYTMALVYVGKIYEKNDYRCFTRFLYCGTSPYQTIYTCAGILPCSIFSDTRSEVVLPCRLKMRAELLWKPGVDVGKVETGGRIIPRLVLYSSLLMSFLAYPNRDAYLCGKFPPTDNDLCAYWEGFRTNWCKSEKGKMLEELLLTLDHLRYVKEYKNKNFKIYVKGNLKNEGETDVDNLQFRAYIGNKLFGGTCKRDFYTLWHPMDFDTLRGNIVMALGEMDNSDVMIRAALACILCGEIKPMATTPNADKSVRNIQYDIQCELKEASYRFFHPFTGMVSENAVKPELDRSIFVDFEFVCNKGIKVTQGSIGVLIGNEMLLTTFEPIEDYKFPTHFSNLNYRESRDKVRASRKGDTEMKSLLEELYKTVSSEERNGLIVGYGLDNDLAIIADGENTKSIRRHDLRVNIVNYETYLNKTGIARADAEWCRKNCGKAYAYVTDVAHVSVCEVRHYMTEAYGIRNHGCEVKLISNKQMEDIIKNNYKI